MSGKYLVHTFGCQMNAHDSDRMSEVLEAHGWTTAGSVEEADLVVLNTCSVREKAEQKLRSEIGKLARFKEAKRGGLVLAVAGCVAQQEGEKLLSRVKELDLVIGPDNLAELPQLVADQMAGAPSRARTVFDLDSPSFLAAAPKPGQAPVSTFITTMKGCDERCSFCIVPYTRGPERYRPAAEIVAEAERWVLAGTREITLLGQTVDSYRDPSLPPPASDDPDESQFPSLLRLLSRVTGLKRIRYTSPHPRHLTPALVSAHRELDVLARHVHMPVQSGSDRMLKRMIRRYTTAEYTKRIRTLLASRSDLTVSTDVIVGFPGETEADFQLTLDLIKDIGFTGLFGFKYSPRPFTPALKLLDDVSEEEKAERLARLFEVSESQGRAHLERLVGTTASVLVEGHGKTGAFEGRSDRNEIVHVASEAGARDLTGEIIDVEITSAFKHSLAGTPTAASLASLGPVTSSMKRPARRRRALPLVVE